MAVANINVSEAGIRSQAEQGKYYDFDKKNWESVGWVEWIVRSILSRLSLMSSVEQACVRYSWQAIENMPEIPQEILRTIATCFIQSRDRNDYWNAAAPSITAVYCKTFPEENKFVIQSVAGERMFRIFKKEVKEGTVVSSEYGKLDFYDNDNRLFLVNTFDDLGPPNQPKTASVTFDYSWPTKKTTLLSGANQPIATICNEGDSTSFVFRDPTNKILAIAIWHIRGYGQKQKWTVTVMPDAKIEPHLLAFPLLKHSQRYLPNPSGDLPYVTNFRSQPR